MPYYSASPNLNDIGNYFSAPKNMGSLYRGFAYVPNITQNNSVVSYTYPPPAIGLDGFRNTNIWRVASYPNSIYGTTINMNIGSYAIGGKSSAYYYGYDTSVLAGSGTSFGSFNGLSGAGPNYNGSPTYPSNCPSYDTINGAFVIRALFQDTSQPLSSGLILILTSTSTYPPNNDNTFTSISITNTAGTVTYASCSRTSAVSFGSYAYWYYRGVWNLPLQNNLPSSGTVKVNFSYYG